MTNPKSKPAMSREPSAEEIRQQQIRAFVQRRESFAQGIMFNALHNPYFDPATTTPETLAKWSVQAAEALLDALYSKREEDK